MYKIRDVPPALPLDKEAWISCDNCKLTEVIRLKYTDETQDSVFLRAQHTWVSIIACRNNHLANARYFHNAWCAINWLRTDWNGNEWSNV